jgi:hypothetical protein
MKTIKYVEAMMPQHPSATVQEARESLDDVAELLTNAGRGGAVSDIRRALRGSTGCADISLEPLGSNDRMSIELERAGFLSADIVAIVRLSDLQALIANQKADAEASATSNAHLRRLTRTPHP